MRYPIFGVVLPSSNVTVYNDDGVTPATIYAAAAGGYKLAGGSLVSGSDGKVRFWVDDSDYPMISYFTIRNSGNIATGIWSFFTTVSPIER